MAVTTPTTGFRGYYRKPSQEPDLFLCSVERETPGGEFMRRFWHPVAYERELGKTPLRVKALGEDLIVFRNLGGAVGCLHLHCAHRNSSLEFGMITEQGIRCCYHFREYAVDGTCIAMPGDPAAERLMAGAYQGAYPTHVYAGIVFIYMGPPERVPVFPILDRFELPGVEMRTGSRRLNVNCNWLQLKENVLDAHHTTTLHLIPQMRGTEHFAGEFGQPPLLNWVETPAGAIYLGARRVDDNIWVRSGEAVFPTVHTISSVFEHGREPKYSSPPFMTFWTLPVDNEHLIQFFISHRVEGDPMTEEQRLFLELFGQYREDRPYEERQWIPGDVDAQESQGPINPHAAEHLGSLDRGVVMFRRQLRREIEAVQRGEDPKGFYLAQSDVPPTYANDFVAPASEVGLDLTDETAMLAFTETVWQKYQQKAPMADFREKNAKA
jgi:phenylpropionate dioxygenase-like ring-hydroxylating dioxygenase large terminal subunit